MQADQAKADAMAMVEAETVRRNTLLGNLASIKAVEGKIKQNEDLAFRRQVQAAQISSEDTLTTVPQGHKNSMRSRSRRALCDSKKWGWEIRANSSSSGLKTGARILVFLTGLWEISWWWIIAVSGLGLGKKMMVNMAVQGLMDSEITRRVQISSENMKIIINNAGYEADS